MVFVLAFAQGIEPRLGIESFLPTSVVGWLGTITTAALLIDRIRNRGKKEGVDETQLNGLGERVKAVESNHGRLEGQFIEHQRTVDRVLTANAQLLTEIGRAERASSLCREDTERYTLEIGSKVDTLRREVLAEVGTLNTSVAKLETEVRLRAEFDARERDRDREG